jgi:uncharacterized phage-associated protein
MDREKVNAASDYIIILAANQGAMLNLVKLQRLLYLAYSLHLTLTNGKRLFEEHFRAWQYGPINQTLQSQFKSPNEQILLRDRFYENPMDAIEQLTEDETDHLGRIMTVYAELSADDLECVLCRDWPWLFTREGLAQQEKSDREITDDVILRHHRESINL